MPGRTSAQNSAVPRTSRKQSTASVTSSVIPDEGPTTILRTSVCGIFADAQKTTAGHRKLVANLRKIQENCCYEPQARGKKGREDFGEEDFNTEIARCIVRVIPIRKGEGAADRIVRFLGLFLRHASEKDAALAPQPEDDETSIPETPTTRLTSHVLATLLPLLASKDKTVRFRSTQIISHVVNSLDSIDDEYYHLVRAGLVKRVRDKEPMVRVQAVLALSRLAGNDDGDEEDAASDDDDSFGLLERLLEILQHDPSAEVRRSLLLNLPITPTTLPYLLERARDLDSATRRALYSRLLPALGDFRHLSLSMREKLLRWGLRDRDDHVRKATAKLFRERWVEDCLKTQARLEEGAVEEQATINVDALLELLERIDVVNSGVENGVALEAMKEFWDGRPDYREALNFDDSFWDKMSAESAFLCRTFNVHCKEGNYETLMEEKMPEVTKFAFYLQRYANELVENIRRIEAAGAEGEEDTADQEFIIEQLLHIALMLDYSDEVGRRKMFSLLREMLAIPELPDEITKLVVEVLRHVCGIASAGERDFCSVVLEAIAEVHDVLVGDDDMDNESFYSAQSELTETGAKRDKVNKGAAKEEERSEEKAIKEIMINMKCLHIAQCMLQNVEENLQDNLHLVTMLNNLVVPAVRSHEAPIRERGLLCLGLCCLLDKKLAEENLTLFFHCFNKGHDVLQITAIRVLCDILMTHSGLLVESSDPAVQKSVTKIFSKGIKAVNTLEVQFAAVNALCKLMLVNVAQDEDLLKQLVVCYFDPVSKDNAAVRQALSYSLPAYCHSRRENMERMGKVAQSVIHAIIGLEDELEEDEEMVGIGVVCNMLVEWTDARKLIVQDTSNVTWNEAGAKEVKAVNGDIHLDLAEGLLENAMSHNCPKNERKILTSMLSKLYVTSNSTTQKLQTVFDLATEAVDSKISNDAPSRNSIMKFHTALSKAITENSTTEAATKTRESSADGTPDKTVLDVEKAVEERVEPKAGEEGSDEEDTIMQDRVVRLDDGGVKDSILDELLEDEESEM